MARSIPTYAVSVAWSDATSGVFTLDTSTLDGSDVLAGFTGGTGTVFDDITTDVKRVACSRGRQTDLSAVEQGRCTITLKDPDGKYNPENASSPLAAYLLPMRPLRVQAWHGGTTYGIFRGFISKIEHNPRRDAQESVIQGVDLLEWLNYMRPSIASTGATTVGVAIGLVLDAIGWSDPALRDLDDGHTIPDFSADGITSTALEIITNLLKVDLGIFFIDGDGIAVYRDTSTRFATSSAITALPESVVSSALPSSDVAQVRNSWSVTRTGGSTQTAGDGTSQARYGIRAGTPISSSYLVSDGQAGALANFLVATFKDPQSPTTGVRIFNRTNESIGYQLGTELSDLVSLSESAGGTSLDAADVVRLEHDIQQAGYFHVVDLLLRKRLFSGFTLDLSTLDGSDVLVY